MIERPTKYDPRNYTKRHERERLFGVVSCDFVDRLILPDRNNLKPLCDLRELCVSVVNLPTKTVTTEAQSPLRMHRESVRVVSKVSRSLQLGYGGSRLSGSGIEIHGGRITLPLKRRQLNDHFLLILANGFFGPSVRDFLVCFVRCRGFLSQRRRSGR